jgi:hypothetical protein
VYRSRAPVGVPGVPDPAGKVVVGAQGVGVFGAQRLFDGRKRLNLPVIEIDTAVTESELTRQVTQTFGL